MAVADKAMEQSQATSATQLAADPELALQNTKLHLLSSKPFYGFVLCSFPCETHSKVTDIAAVVAKGTTLTIHINPETFPRLPLSVRGKILEHEILHLLHRHLPVRPDVDPMLWNIACFKPDEPILTSQGLKPIAEVRPGDELIGGGEVTALMARPYSGKMYRIKPWGCEPVVATEEHPFLVVRLRRKDAGGHRLNGPWDLEHYEEAWVPAKDLASALRNTGHTRGYLAIPRLPGTFKQQELDLDPYMGRDRWGDPSHRAVLKRLPLNEDVAFVMGLYVAEGSRASSKGGIQFSLGAHEQGRAEQVANLFRELGFSPRVGPGSHSAVISVSVPSIVLGRAFSDWFGRGARSKRVPTWLLYHEDLGLVRAFLEGYFAGDGARARKGHEARVAWTVSPTLARQIQLLGARLGELITVDHHLANNAGRTIRGRAIEKAQEGYNLYWSKPRPSTRFLNGQEVTSYSNRWKVTDRYVLVPATVTEEWYDGPVYNVETETHRYLAGNVVVHNCDLAINTLMKPNHPDYQDPEHPERSLLCLLPERVERSVGIKLPPSGDAELYYSLLLKDKERHGGAGVVIIISPDGKHKAIAREDDPRLGKGWKVYDLHPHFAKGLDPSNPEGGLSAPLPSPEMLDAEIRAIVEEAAKMAGSIPDSLKSVIEKLYKPKIDWRRILRRFAGSVISEATFRTWMKPNRRIPFLPGKRRELEASIVAIIDTSGSMSDQQLAAIGSELYQISKLTNSTVTVVEADAEVQRHYVLTAPTLKVKMKQGFQGRGGTAFRPAFEWAEARHPDGIIYFTDGYNYDEEWLENHRPPCPVLWVITHDGRIPAKWGWKVKLPEPRD